MDDTVGTSKLSKIIGITERQILKLVDKGVLEKIDRGKFNLADCVQAYIRFKEREFNSYKGDLTEERTRLTKLQADKAEMEIEVMRGSFLPADLCIKAWQEMVNTAKTRLLSISNSVKMKFPYLEDDVLSNIDEEHRTILSELSKDGIPDNLRKRMESYNGDVGPASELEGE